MTGQEVLNIMEMLNQELQLQTGEADYARGLLALNVAQDYFESLAALRPGIFGSTTGTVTTTSGEETTTWPTGLLRLDRLQLLDASGRPVRDIHPLNRIGGHAGSQQWPLYVTASQSTGAPVSYKDYGGLIYWQPVPDDTHTIRWYGFQAADALTATGTFAYPDLVALPLASLAVQMLKSGIDDDPRDVGSLAMTSFSVTLDTLTKVNRDGPKGLFYTTVHTE